MRRQEHELGSIAMTLFARQVEIARRTLRSGSSALSPHTSASQMFESSSPVHRDGRSRALRDEYNADRNSRVDAGASKTASSDARSVQGRVTPTTLIMDSTSNAGRGTRRAATSENGLQLSKSFSEIPGSGKGRSVGAKQAIGLRPSTIELSSIQNNASSLSSTKALGVDVSTGQPVNGQAGASGASSPADHLAKIVGTSRASTMTSLRGDATPPPPSTTSGAKTPSAKQETTGSQRTSSFSGTQQSGETTDKASLFADLVKSIRTNHGLRRSSARIRLDPPKLGRLRVDLRIQGDVVRVDVQTETDAARSLVKERAGWLREALEQQGLHVEHFEVVTDDATLRDDTTTPGSDSQRKAQDRRDPSTSRSKSFLSDVAATEALDVERGVKDDGSSYISSGRIDVRI